MNIPLLYLFSQEGQQLRHLRRILLYQQNQLREDMEFRIPSDVVTRAAREAAVLASIDPSRVTPCVKTIRATVAISHDGRPVNILLPRQDISGKTLTINNMRLSWRKLRRA